jgi:hypothetical protein
VNEELGRLPGTPVELWHGGTTCSVVLLYLYFIASWLKCMVKAVSRQHPHMAVGTETRKQRTFIQRVACCGMQGKALIRCIAVHVCLFGNCTYRSGRVAGLLKVVAVLSVSLTMA